MYILHSTKKGNFDVNSLSYGQDSIDRFGFIHCSDFDTYYLVAPNFKDEQEKRLLLVIDTDKLSSPVRWENGGRFYYPHIYGLLNKDAIVEVLPHLWSNNKEWIPNKELDKYVTNQNMESYKRKI